MDTITNPTANELIALLDHANGTRRRQAALALGGLRDPAVAPALVAHLRAETPGCGVHEDLTWATVQHIDEALPGVLAMLTDEDPHIRRTGAHVLSKVGNPDHADHLAPLVADPDADVAIKAYRALATTGQRHAHKALAVLAARLGDGDELQRDALTTAFQRFGADSAPVLAEALSSSDAVVRAHAADALGYLGADAVAATEALTVAACDADPDVRIAAVSALGQIGEPAAKALTRLAGSPDPVVARIAGHFLPGH